MKIKSQTTPILPTLVFSSLIIPFSTYTYDHQGQRIKLDNGTNTSIYPSKYYNISSDGTITKHIFTPSGELLATIEGNGTATSTKYIHTDYLGGSSGSTFFNIYGN